MLGIGFAAHVFVIEYTDTVFDLETEIHDSTSVGRQMIYRETAP